MSKRELKTYLHELTKEQLEEQVVDLYTRFKEVKTYYDFAFNPNEQKLVEDCKFRISKEYFPINTRRPKTRRSIAQKSIKNFITLGVDPLLITDVMLYNIEIAQAYSADREIRQIQFYQSILKSFEQAVDFCLEHSIISDFSERFSRIVEETENQNWINSNAFDNILKRIIKRA